MYSSAVVVKSTRQIVVSNPMGETTDDVRVQNIPLNHQEAAKIIVEMYGGKESIQRAEIVAPVLAKWKERGGIAPPNARDVVYRATQELKRTKLAYNESGSPTWKIYQAPYEDSSEELDRAIDQGGSAYAYWYPAYQELASLKNEKYWRIKIGYTESDVARRVQDQLGTATAETPIIVTLNEGHGRAWERVLHGCLDLANRRIDDTQGNEWYLTNPDELRAIMEFISGIDCLDDVQAGFSQKT